MSNGKKYRCLAISFDVSHVLRYIVMSIFHTLQKAADPTSEEHILQFSEVVETFLD